MCAAHFFRRNLNFKKTTTNTEPNRTRPNRIKLGRQLGSKWMNREWVPSPLLDWGTPVYPALETLSQTYRITYFLCFFLSHSLPQISNYISTPEWKEYSQKCWTIIFPHVFVLVSEKCWAIKMTSGKRRRGGQAGNIKVPGTGGTYSRGTHMWQ